MCTIEILRLVVQVKNDLNIYNIQVGYSPLINSCAKNDFYKKMFKKYLKKNNLHFKRIL